MTGRMRVRMIRRKHDSKSMLSKRTTIYDWKRGVFLQGDCRVSVTREIRYARYSISNGVRHAACAGAAACRILSAALRQTSASSIHNICPKTVLSRSGYVQHMRNEGAFTVPRSHAELNEKKGFPPQNTRTTSSQQENQEHSDCALSPFLMLFLRFKPGQIYMDGSNLLHPPMTSALVGRAERLMSCPLYQNRIDLVAVQEDVLVLRDN